MSTQLLLGLLCSTLIGGLGFRRGSLSRSGWLGAIFVGTTTFGFGGWLWGGLIIVFFVASSALSKLGQQQKYVATQQIWDKADTRDLWQVLANGGVPACAAIGYTLAPSSLWWAAALGAIAAATADTWATEIGVFSKQQPVHVFTRQPLVAGMSGGVSWAGSLGSLAGALLIALVAFAGLWLDPRFYSWPSLLVALVGGCVGSFIDSVLGATRQALRWCPQCEQTTEQYQHHCGTQTVHHAGWRWLNNDVVNGLSILLAAVVSVGLWIWLV